MTPQSVGCADREEMNVLLERVAWAAQEVLDEFFVWSDGFDGWGYVTHGGIPQEVPDGNWEPIEILAKALAALPAPAGPRP